MTEGNETTNSGASKDLNGIRGWLWYLTAGLVITVPIYLYSSLNYFKMVKDYGTFGRAWVVIFIAITSLLTAVAFAYSSFLIIRHKKLGRMVLFYSLIAAGVFAYISISLLDQTYSELVAKELITAADKQAVASTWPSEFGRSILSSVIWAIYSKRSKRVKETLIN